MKIVKYALGKEYENKQIFLDDNGKTHIVYVMPKGLQLLTLGDIQPELEEAIKILDFCHEFINLYIEEEKELLQLVNAAAGGTI